jgi:ABC-type multidrug transport system permease subunit
VRSKLPQIIGSLHRIFAFFRRDAKNVSSYKLNFIFSIISMFIWSFTMGALGKITQPAQTTYMEAYGNMNAATFLIIGFMLNRFLQQSQFAPQSIASPGNIERILLTPCSIPVFILGSMSWRYFWSSLNLLVFIFMGTMIFGMDILAVDWITFIIVLVVGIMAMWGLGIISSAIQLVTKQWNPVNWFLQTFSFLVSGVFFSPEALLTVDSTGVLYGAAWCLPQTYVYHMARLAFAGEGILEMLSPLFNLVVMAAFFFGAGWLTFKLCLRYCQLEGSLGWV